MVKMVSLRSTFSRPADATQYAAGDEVSNHATAGSVVRATFDLTGFSQGQIMSAGIDITPASSNVVITALDLELMLFLTKDVPAAVGDNVTHPITGPQRITAIGIFRFDDGAWTNQLGAVTASTSAAQQAMAHLVQPLASPVLQAPFYPGHHFQFDGVANKQLTAVLRTLAAWNPTAVVNTIGISLDLHVE
jgi:hypothetical protein